MKTLRIYAVLLATAFIGFACNPIEDESLREKYFKNAGTPISTEELNAALSVMQPIPNLDDKVEGDQYVVIDNKRPDIGGTWHVGTSTGERIVGTNHDTVIYTSNGTFDIYYVGVSANQMVRSKNFSVEVTNCFDEYDRLLSGAENKADRTAKKSWRLADGDNVVYNGMYGNWKYNPDFKPGANAWGTVNISQELREQSVVFEFNNHRVVTYSGSGTVVSEGSWAYTHENPEQVTGELIMTHALPGQSYSWNVFSGVATPYWILRISNSELVLCFPSTYNKPPTTEDWDIDATYFFFVPKE